MVLLVYVDNIILIENDDLVINRAKQFLDNKFKINDLSVLWIVEL